MSLTSKIMGVVSRALPLALSNGDEAPVRLDRYGNVYVKNHTKDKYAIADSGRYFTTTNPTSGTAIAFPVSATYDATKPWFIFQNNNPLGGPRAFMDYLKLQVTVAAASGTSVNMAIVRDRLTTLITTDHVINQAPANVNGDDNLVSACRFLYQTGATATVIGALSPSAVKVASGSCGGLTIVSDELVFDFGANAQAAYPGLTAVQATAPGRKVTNMPPLICAPQQQLIFYFWALNNASTGLSAEFEFAHYES